jgi:hypothetical protein
MSSPYGQSHFQWTPVYIIDIDLVKGNLDLQERGGSCDRCDPVGHTYSRLISTTEKLRWLGDHMAGQRKAGGYQPQ